MGKPFADLEKRALAILGNGGDPAQSLDRELASYWTWRINPSANSHDLPAASERSEGRKLDSFAINPFGLSMGANTFAKVTMSKRTQAWLTTELKSTLQVADIIDSITAYRLANFTPAKVYARTGAADTPVERTSRITGRKYKSYYAAADQGYTMPFGQQAETDTVQARQTAVEAAIKKKDPTIDLISFSPEKLRT